jgi:hypothetical protein
MAEKPRHKTTGRIYDLKIQVFGCFRGAFD